MYQVIHQGKVVGSFNYFFDAWLYVRLELVSFARIIGSGEDYLFDPKESS